MVTTLVNVLSAAVSPSLGTKVVVVVGGIVVVGGVVVVVVDVVEVVVELDVVVSTDTETLDVVATDPAEVHAEAKTTRERTTATKRHASFFQQKVINVFFSLNRSRVAQEPDRVLGVTLPIDHLDTQAPLLSDTFVTSPTQIRQQKTTNTADSIRFNCIVNDALNLLRTTPFFLFVVLATACSTIVGETPTDSAAEANDPASVTATSEAEPRECLRPTGGIGPVDTGTTSGNALFLSGELFVCAFDVVVVAEDDLNEVAAAAQLAAALGGPLLFPDDRLAAEIGRLHPNRVHVVGQVSLNTPTQTDVHVHDVQGAVSLASEALGVTEEVRLPAVPDASTIIETVGAITDGNSVVLPQTSPTGTTTPPLAINQAELVSGLAVANDSSSIWMVDASDPVTVLLSAGTGHAVDARTIAIDGSDLFEYSEVGVALQGPGKTLRFIGGAPEVDDWKISVLTNGQQLPGGGFVILPEHQRRYVAFYGHPDTSALGVLGEQNGEATIERMEPFLTAYEGDGAQAIATFEIIATVASAGPGDDGNYSYEWPDDTFDDLLETAERHDAYVLLDLQPGRTDFLTQAKVYENLLMRPYIGLALDPEWRLKPDQIHLQQTGSVDATEINTVIDWLGDLVRNNGLPQKMLLLHMFRLDMIENRDTLIDRPELQVVIQMDGDGTEAQKEATWDRLRNGYEDAFWSWGWKNFFDEDEPGPPTPESTISKKPTPVYISYQ